jgi:hypothetical protein
LEWRSYLAGEVGRSFSRSIRSKILGSIRVLIELGVPLAGAFPAGTGKAHAGTHAPRSVNTNVLHSIVADVKGSFRIALTNDRAIWNSLSRLHRCKIPS